MAGNVIFHHNKIKLIINFRPILLAMDDELWRQLSCEEKIKFKQLQGISRQMEWCETRRSLYKIFNENQNSKLQKISSVSHAWYNESGLAAAAGYFDLQITSKNNMRVGLGIDVENKNRIISNLVVQSILSGIELILTLDPLWIWIIKEACFKANPLLNKSTDLKHYQIQYYDHALKTGYALETTSFFQFNFRLIELKDWRIALAATNN